MVGLSLRDDGLAALNGDLADWVDDAWEWKFDVQFDHYAYSTDGEAVALLLCHAWASKMGEQDGLLVSRWISLSIPRKSSPILKSRQRFWQLTQRARKL